MSKNIYERLYDDSHRLFRENLILLIQECQIFSKYFLNTSWFFKHLSLPLWILGRCTSSFLHILKALVLYLPGLFDKPFESFIYLTAGLIFEALNFMVSVINLGIALLSLPVRIMHSFLRLTNLVDANHIDDSSIEDTMYASLHLARV